jgi:hypothetical protein
MFHLSENLTLHDLFKICKAKLLPEGCTIFDRTGGKDKQVWPADLKITKSLREELGFPEEDGDE